MSLFSKKRQAYSVSLCKRTDCKNVNIEKFRAKTTPAESAQNQTLDIRSPPREKCSDSPSKMPKMSPQSSFLSTTIRLVEFLKLSSISETFQRDSITTQSNQKFLSSNRGHISFRNKFQNPKLPVRFRSKTVLIS